MDIQEVRTSVFLRKQVLGEVQEFLRLTYGKVKGVQEECINDALKLWLGFAGKKPDTVYGKVLLDKVEEFKVFTSSELTEVLRKCKFAHLKPGNQDGRFTAEIYHAVLKWAESEKAKLIVSPGSLEAKIADLNWETIKSNIAFGKPVYFILGNVEHGDIVNLSLFSRKSLSLTSSTIHVLTRETSETILAKPNLSQPLSLE